MSEYEESSPLCWKPARATFVIPPGRSDHEPCRAAGKAYGGPALTTYQRATSAVNGYWQTASANSLHVQGAQLTTGSRRVTEAQKDHIILGTDNYFKSSQTKWDQHIGERPPRTRGVPGYTGVQPRPEQVRGTPDHTQRPVKPSDPDLLNTHCRLIPSYAGLANATASATGMQSTTAVPRLNLAAVSAEKGHAGRDACLLAGQCSTRSDCGGHSGAIAAQSGPMGSLTNPQGVSPSPAQARSAEGAAPPQAATARPAVGGASMGVQGGFQPVTARGPPAPCPTGHYHSSGASTWRGTCSYPLAIGSSRHRGNECYGGVRNSSNGLPPFALQTTYCRGW